MTKNTYTAILEKEGELYVALCPELDVASQGSTVEETTTNLKEAIVQVMAHFYSRQIIFSKQ